MVPGWPLIRSQRIAKYLPATYNAGATLFLFLTGVVGGLLNSVAGGGSFVGLPALIVAGVPPVAANATATFALWPGSVASAIAYRRELGATRSWLLPLVAVSFAGGLIGGLLLVRTSDTSFMHLLPWLMLLAALAFTVGEPLTTRSGLNKYRGASVPWWALLMQFAIAVYGGFFGGGMGIMMLATMSLAGLTDIHEMNALKLVLGSTLNGVALVAFVASGAIVWQPGFVMMAGAILGGYAGASMARVTDRRHIRAIVIVVAWTMTVYFFVKR